MNNEIIMIMATILNYDDHDVDDYDDENDGDNEVSDNNDVDVGDDDQVDKDDDDDNVFEEKYYIYFFNNVAIN